MFSWDLIFISQELIRFLGILYTILMFQRNALSFYHFLLFYIIKLTTKIYSSYYFILLLKTRKENAKDESVWLLDRLNLTGITHFGNQYKTHLQSVHQWMELDQRIIQKLYRHYWLDFVLLGYDTATVKRFIEYGKKVL